MSKRGSQAAAARMLKNNGDLKIGCVEKAENWIRGKARMLKNNGGFGALRKTLWRIGYGEKAEKVQLECIDARKRLKDKLTKTAYGGPRGLKEKMSMSSVLVLTGFADLVMKSAMNVYSALQKKKPKEGAKELWTTLSGADTKEVSEGVKDMTAKIQLILSQHQKTDFKLEILNAKMDRLLAGQSPPPSGSAPPIASRLPAESGEDVGNSGNDDGGE